MGEEYPTANPAGPGSTSYAKEAAVSIGLPAKEIARVKPPLPRRSPENHEQELRRKKEKQIGLLLRHHYIGEEFVGGDHR
jgi:hypothetical protein